MLTVEAKYRAGLRIAFLSAGSKVRAVHCNSNPTETRMGRSPLLATGANVFTTHNSLHTGNLAVTLPLDLL